MTDQGQAWIGPPPKPAQIAVIMLSAALAIVITISLQPILLGGLLSEHRLTLAQVGQTASVELLAMAIMATIAGALFQTERLRLKAALAGIGLLAANVLTLFAADIYVMLARALSGVCCGVYLWIVTCMLMRSHNAARYAGIITAIQAALSVGLSYLMGALASSQYGANAGYICLAALAAALAAAFLLFPARFEAIAGQQGARVPPARGFAALAVIFIYLAGLIGVWVYVGAFAQQSGQTPAQIGVTVSIALAAQFVGALAASVLGNRVNASAAIILGAAGAFALVLAMPLQLPLPLYQAVIALFALLWMFSTPFLVPMAMDVDPSRVSALYVFTVQSVGAAAGPAICAMLIQGGNVRGAIFGAGLLILAAGVLLLVVRLFWKAPASQAA